MRFLIMFILQASLLFRAAAQENPEPYSDYNWALRSNPLGLADFLDHNINLGTEFRFHKKWSFSTDLAYIFYSRFYNQSKGASGYMVKPAIRYYAVNRARLFFEWDIFYKHVGYKMEDWIGKNCVNGVPTFDMNTLFVLQKKVVGTNIKIGKQFNISEDKRLKAEVYLGLGIRHRWSSIKNDPNACFRNGGLFGDEFINGPITLPGLPAGIRFIYVVSER